IMGKNILKLVQDAFYNGYSGTRLLETLIVLILKINSPTSFKYLRHITLCNVLVNKLKPYLDDLIDPMRSSFIHGRGSVNNCVRFGSLSILWNDFRLDPFKPTRDDVLLFFKASNTHMRMLTSTLDDICEASKMNVNFRQI
ncbi:hypothetical protein Lal_00020222, partial [Lupinus albus]